jgi:hypothetical protein
LKSASSGGREIRHGEGDDPDRLLVHESAMTSSDHNKTLWLIHGLVGVIVLTVLTIILAGEPRKDPPVAFDSPPAAPRAGGEPANAPHRVGTGIYFMPLPLLQLLTAYGLLRRRRWGKALALLLSALYVFVFPLGTLLAVYTYWFLHSADARRLYAKDENPA